MGRRRVRDAEYGELLAFRDGLRRFLRWSESRAEAAGLTPAKHQLLLAVRGHDDPRGPTVGEIAEHLLIRHHSAVGLLDRAEAAGLVARTPDRDDQRTIRIRLTDEGAHRLERLAADTLEELRRVAPGFRRLWQGLDPANRAAGV